MTTLQTIKRFFEPALVCKFRIFQVALQAAIWVSYPIAWILTMKFITKAALDQSYHIFTQTVIWFTIYNVVYFILKYLTRHWGWPATHPLRRTIHEKYVSWFFTLDNNYVEKIGTGRMISMLEKWIGTWAGLLVDLINNVVYHGGMILFFCYVLANIHLMLIPILIVTIIGMLLTLSYFNRWTINMRAEKIIEWREYSRMLIRCVMSKYETLANGRIDAEIKRLDEQSCRYELADFKLDNPLAFMFNLPILIVSILRVSLFVITGYFLFYEHLSFEVFVMIFFAFWYLDSSVINATDAYKNFTKDFPEVRKLWDDFDQAPLIHGYNEGNQFKPLNGTIEVKNLSFSYGDNPIFSDFSLSITGGKKTALVGLSGSGKSTLVKLIAGYLHPTSGSVIVDGQNLSEVKLRDYYSHIGYLTQDPSVFDGTILENLTYGARSEVSEESLKNAIELAQCEFIYEFTDGLKTEIGEKGVRLSGGQRQRLAIAKIFIKNPEIIILDEPTSALDSFSEEKINIAFHNLFQGRTVIVIAHRLQTVKEADDIIVLDHGTIVERGNHAELVESAWVYAKMLELQSGF